MSWRKRAGIGMVWRNCVTVALSIQPKAKPPTSSVVVLPFANEHGLMALKYRTYWVGRVAPSHDESVCMCVCEDRTSLDRLQFVFSWAAATAAATLVIARRRSMVSSLSVTKSLLLSMLSASSWRCFNYHHQRGHVSACVFLALGLSKEYPNMWMNFYEILERDMPYNKKRLIRCGR